MKTNLCRCVYMSIHIVGLAVFIQLKHGGRRVVHSRELQSLLLFPMDSHHFLALFAHREKLRREMSKREETFFGKIIIANLAGAGEYRDFS